MPDLQADRDAAKMTGMIPAAGPRVRLHRSWVLVVVAWLLVSVPLLWGVWQTVKKAAALFR